MFSQKTLRRQLPAFLAILDTYENDDQRISKTAKKIKTISREQLPAALNVALFMESGKW
jgi:hypothetical protein